MALPKDARATVPWPPRRRGRQALVIAIAAGVQVVSFVALLQSAPALRRVLGPAVTEVTIFVPRNPPPVPSRVTARVTPPHAEPTPRDRLPKRLPAQELSAPTTPSIAPDVAIHAITAAPPASAASEPLRLTLTRDQLKSLESSAPKTLAQSVAAPPPPTSLQRVGGVGDAFVERRLPDGSVETHVHGECYVQSNGLAARLDPFKHSHDNFVAKCDHQ